MQCHARNVTHIHVKYTRCVHECHMPCSYASSPHRLSHTCIFPCMKIISKTKGFVLVLAKVSWTNSDKILDHPPIFFSFGQTPIIMWTTLRYSFFWTDSDKFGGQPSEKNHLFMWCIHTQYARCPHAREVHNYCMIFIYFHACM